MASAGECTLRVENEDRLSVFPDSILSHILAFLPTVDAVKTSVLSTRWTHAWTSVTDLEFDDESFFHHGGIQMQCKGQEVFSNFVNRVMIVRSHPYVRRFKLILRNSYSSSDVNSWIYYAISHCVEELTLSIFYGSLFRIPRLLFICSTLRVLKLDSGVDMKLIPDSIYLPRLKVLHLSGLPSLCDSQLETLLFGSPILEELVVSKVGPDLLRSICVQSASLKSLVLSNSNSTTESRFFRVFVDAPGLELLELQDNTSQEYDVDIVNLSPIARVVLNLCTKIEYDDCVDGDWVARIMRHACNAKYLSLSPYMVKALAVSGSLYLPRFFNLTQLFLQPCQNGWLFLPKILKCSCNLKVLVIMNKDIPLGTKEENDAIPKEVIFPKDSIPPCFKSSLETLHFTRFLSSPIEIKLIRYFLENAVLLKQIIISSWNASYIDWEAVMEKLFGH